MQSTPDLLVIGAGSAGVRAARTAAALGVQQVVVVENQCLGGTCVNVGCVPKKLYAYAAQYAQAFEDARGFGWEVATSKFCWSRMQCAVADEITRLNQIYHDLLANAKVTLINDTARFIDSQRIRVGGKIFTPRHILIAVGSTPFVPDIPGREWVLTSDQFFHLRDAPDSIVVWGSGYIALELASICARLGVQTTLVYRSRRVLKHFDQELTAFVQQGLADIGIQLLSEDNLVAITLEGASRQVHLSSGKTLRCAAVLCATGRVPNTAALNLSAAGVRTSAQGAIKVNAHYQTNIAHIYALGDVIARLALTPVAIAEAMILAHRLFAASPLPPLDYRLVPTAVFCYPNLATVGLSEDQAREQYARVVVYRSKFIPLKHRLSGLLAQSLVKVVVDEDSDRVLGVHMAGEEAAEIVQGFAAALQAGISYQQLIATIGIHPTTAEELVTLR